MKRIPIKKYKKALVARNILLAAAAASAFALIYFIIYLNTLQI